MICKSAKISNMTNFNLKLKEFIYLFRGDFNNFEASTIKILNNE